MPDMASSDANLAFLYASGEMDQRQAADFERRLGEEQSLREALCQAVELMQTLEGLAPPAPRRAYRQRVQRRLRPSGQRWSWLAGRRAYRGHPALWSGLGAAAVVLVVLIVPPTWLPVERPTPTAVVEQPSRGESEPPRDVPTAPATIEMAEVWANLHNSDHLARARDEENRRRSRLAGPSLVRR